MLNEYLNTLRFDLYIKTIDPLLIKSGIPGISGVDNAPITALYPGQQEPLPFIPGSSLKGVFRSHLEKVIRTITPLEKSLVCLPYEVAFWDKKFNRWDKRSSQSTANQIFCGNKLEYLEKKGHWKQSGNTPSSEEAYKNSCPICRLFGSTYFKGRVAVSDAYLTEKGIASCTIQRRDGIAIDRFTGGAASRALFQSEVVNAAEFKTTICLRNFEIWQLGMLFLLIKDLADKQIRIGSCTSRGLGLIEGSIKDLTIDYMRTLRQTEKQIWGIGKIYAERNKEKIKNYGLFADDFLAFNEVDTWPCLETAGIRSRLNFTENSQISLLTNNAIEHFLERMQSWQGQGIMQFDHRNEFKNFQAEKR